MKKILIVGATSAIAEATGRLWAAEGAALHLVARDVERLAPIARDLEVRGAAQVTSSHADFAAAFDAAALVNAAHEALAGLDIVLVAHGVLPEQRACEQDLAQLRLSLEVNTLSVLAVLSCAANLCEAQGHGSLIVLSSVAADRGRRSNYVYGASKAAVDTFASGLRGRLAGRGVRVLTIKPGFVDTPMTASFSKGPLWARPETIAAGILRALEKGRDVAYLPGFWRVIMFVVRHIPERIFKRLPL